MGVVPMTDREMLTDWIGDFIAYWQLSGFSEQDAADAIMCVLSGYPTLFAQEKPRLAPDPVALCETLANPRGRERVDGRCDYLLALHQSSQKSASSASPAPTQC